MKVKFYDSVKDELLKFAVIISKSKDKWVFCKHKARDTYEVPGGHREPGETIEETARRELYEETGALSFEIKPICVYSVEREADVDEGMPGETFGMLYYAEIHEFESELNSEIERIILTDKLPDQWTYPLIQPKLMAEAVKRGVIEVPGKNAMKVLVIGGTRFFGIYTVNALLKKGHEVTIATRGRAQDDFGNKVGRIILERTDAESVRETLTGRHFDVVIDKLAYSSNDIKNVMEVLDCNRYIQMSSTAVYEPKHINTKEEDFCGLGKELIWCDRNTFPYDEIKRQAECALQKQYAGRKWTAVRYPFVIGEDDYTGRLQFYVEHTMKSIPMHIDNLDAQMGFIRSDEAGEFIAFLAEEDFEGPINGSSHGTISLKEIIDYVESKTDAKAVITKEGDEAPYNGELEYSINTDKAEALGFRFTELKDWIYELLDYYIEEVNKEIDNIFYKSFRCSKKD